METLILELLKQNDSLQKSTSDGEIIQKLSEENQLMNKKIKQLEKDMASQKPVNDINYVKVINLLYHQKGVYDKHKNARDDLE